MKKALAFVILALLAVACGAQAPGSEETGSAEQAVTVPECRSSTPPYGLYTDQMNPILTSSVNFLEQGTTYRCADGSTGKNGANWNVRNTQAFAPCSYMYGTCYGVIACPRFVPGTSDGPYTSTYTYNAAIDGYVEDRHYLHYGNFGAAGQQACDMYFDLWFTL